MTLAIYMLHKPEDRLNGWFAIYDSKNEKFIAWDYLHSIGVKLPQYMKQYLNPDNDYPVILKRKHDAEKVVSAIRSASGQRLETADSQTSFVETTWLNQTRAKAAQ